MHKQEDSICDGNKKAKIMTEQTRYKIGKQIGSGTFGKVFEAIDLQTHQKVAIKEAFQDKKYKNRELSVLSGLDNDNIVELRDYYYIQRQQNKYLYLVMDVFQTNLQILLRQMRKDKRKFMNIDIKIMAFQIFKALYYLRTMKVCHRDIKPPNILVNTSTWEIRLCDFGSAKVFSQVQKNVTYICSRYYRSPELLLQYSMYGTEVDIWSAGCILVQLLTKQPLFPGDSTVEQLIEIMKVLGAPSEAYLYKYADQYKDDLHFPEIPPAKWEKILKKYNVDLLFTDLISKILIYDTEKRLTPYQILTHEYFKDLNSNENKKYTQKLPNLFKFSGLLSVDQSNKKQIETLQSIFNKTRNYKQVTSIENELCLVGNSSKLQTGDSTPIIATCSKQGIAGTADTIHLNSVTDSRISQKIVT